MIPEPPLDRGLFFHQKEGEGPEVPLVSGNEIMSKKDLR